MKICTRFLLALFLLIGLGLAACQPLPAACDGVACGTSTPCASAGCPSATPQSPPVPSLTPQPTRQIAIQTDHLRGTSILFLHGANGDLQKALQKLTNEFNQTNRWGIDVQVSSTGSQSSLVDDLLSAETGQAPNLALLYPEQAWRLEDKGKEVLNLQPYLEDSEVGLSSLDLKDISETSWRQDHRKGEVYGVPALRELSILVYNRTWAAELGFPNPPQTFEEFRAQACAAAQENLGSEIKENHGTGGWLVSYDPLTAASWLRASGMPVFFTTEITPVMNNSQAQAELSALRQLVVDNCAWLGKETEPYSYFATRKALFYSGSTTDLPEQAKAMTQAGSDDEWTVIPYPGRTEPSLVLESGPSYYIFSGDANIELAAWLFVRWLIQPEQQIKLDQASWSIPVSQALRSDPSRVGITSPQWETAVQLSAIAEEAPSSSTWYLARNVLSDAFRQVFQPETKEEDLPLLLQQLDSTIQDVANH